MNTSKLAPDMKFVSYLIYRPPHPTRKTDSNQLKMKQKETKTDNSHSGKARSKECFQL